MAKRLDETKPPIEALGPMQPRFAQGEDTDADETMMLGPGFVPQAPIPFRRPLPTDRPTSGRYRSRVDPDDSGSTLMAPSPIAEPPRSTPFASRVVAGAEPFDLERYASLLLELESATTGELEVWKRRGIDDPRRAKDIEAAFRKHFEEFPDERRRLGALLERGRRRGS